MFLGNNLQFSCKSIFILYMAVCLLGWQISVAVIENRAHKAKNILSRQVRKLPSTSHTSKIHNTEQPSTNRNNGRRWASLIDFLLTAVLISLPVGEQVTTLQGLPGGSDGIDSGYSARNPGSIPGLGRSPGEGNGDFLPGKSHGQRSLKGYSPWGRKESDMTE